jgi:predicted small integral membrane protein
MGTSYYITMGIVIFVLAIMTIWDVHNGGGRPRH